MEQNQTNIGQRNWYDKSYKWLLLIPAILLVFSLIFMVSFYGKTGDFINKDVSLTGGTSITIFDSNASISDLETKLKTDFPDISLRGISDFGTGKQKGIIIETVANSSAIKAELESILGYELTTENSSIEFSGATLSAGFYGQLRNSIVAAFLLMALVVFLIFSEKKFIKGITIMVSGLGLGIILNEIPFVRNVSIIGIVIGFIYASWKGEKTTYKWHITLSVFVLSLLLLFVYPNMFILIPVAIALIALYFFYSVPSFAVIWCAFIDILMTIVAVDLLGIKLSLAGIIAFLMLIGYSVDTDILLTTRLLKKKEGTINQRIYGAFKTGMTMTITSLAAAGVSLLIIYNFSDTLRQIFTIIVIGLIFDVLNTWITNASLLKWYMEVKRIQ
jgi:preprotein translocase subunit SecF